MVFNVSLSTLFIKFVVIFVQELYLLNAEHFLGFLSAILIFFFFFLTKALSDNKTLYMTFEHAVAVRNFKSFLCQGARLL